jgi:hypothetical protein
VSDPTQNEIGFDGKFNPTYRSGTMGRRTIKSSLTIPFNRRKKKGGGQGEEGEGKEKGMWCVCACVCYVH